MKALACYLSVFALCLFSLAGQAKADLVFSSMFLATFDFEVVEGPFTSIDGISAGDILPFSAIGSLQFTLDDSVPGASSMAFLNATGTLTGIAPAAFMPFAITPNAEFVGGSLDNIERDSEGQIVAADVVGLQMLWEMSGNPAILGGDDVLLYTTDALEFNGAISSIPFAIGDLLAGHDDFEVYLDTGLGNPGLPDGDPLAVIGRNRTLTVVPEPGSLGLITMIGGMLIVGGRFRRVDVCQG